MKRDYNSEIKNNKDRDYFYNFDIDVMHPFMFETFERYLKNDDVLELGSFDGSFTKLLQKTFREIHCIEASSDAIQIAQNNLSGDIHFHKGTFENVNLDRKFNNIILTHVLEHLDNPVEELSNIRKRWLTDGGRLFVVCPNANAPSRQIAVRMGLIDYNSAVTEGEKEHGHTITYTFDTLRRDVVKAGLNPVSQEGIFFKALANFQWDQAIQNGIVSKEYLRGCFELGKIYPDLCSSIFILCEK